MAASLSSLIFGALLAIVFLVLPGFALLRLCVPERELGFISRLTLAPGVTTAFCVLMFAWGKIVGLKFGPVTPWLMIAGAICILTLRRTQGTWTLAIPSSLRRLGRVSIGEWLAGLALAAILAVLLVVRLKSTLGWIAPPGLDSPHHTVIVQLLLEHHGLFDSWSPYSDAETFTYHFGFHAVAALFAWLSGSDAIFAVFVMARVLGVCATAALAGLVRLWTRSAWGGVFAAAAWELYSRQLYSFDPPGRWTTLAGLTVLPAALVLLSLFLRAETSPGKWRLGLLCVVASAGLVLAQYKFATIFAVLAIVLFCSRGITTMLDKRPGRHARVLEICLRAFAIVVVSSLLVVPRLRAVMQTKTGQALNRILLEASPAPAHPMNMAALFPSGFTGREEILVLCLALLIGLVIFVRRRSALWFVIGWVAVAIVVNPRLIGFGRMGLIDHDNWTFAFPTAIAVLTGLAIGLICEKIREERNLAWNGAFFGAALFMSGWGALRSLPVWDINRLVLADDLPAMEWIKAHVPENERIAGRGYLFQGIVLEHEAIMWVPFFTRHRTNHTLLAAILEKAPVAEREKSALFTSALYSRDMSTPESAAWMQEQGYRWFYFAAHAPSEHGVTAWERTERHRNLLEQMERNPGLELVFSQGAARLYRVR